MIPIYDLKKKKSNRNVNKLNYTRHCTVLYSGSTVWPDNYSLSITTDNGSLRLTCDRTAQYKHAFHLSGSTISCSGSSRTQQISYPNGPPLIENRLIMSALFHTSIFSLSLHPLRQEWMKPWVSSFIYFFFFGKGPHPLLWANSRAARRKITVSGTHHYLNYREIYTAYTQFTNVTASRIIQPGGHGSGAHEFNKCWPTCGPGHLNVSVTQFKKHNITGLQNTTRQFY